MQFASFNNEDDIFVFILLGISQNTEIWIFWTSFFIILKALFLLLISNISLMAIWHIWKGIR